MDEGEAMPLGQTNCKRVQKIGVERYILTSTGCTSDCITGQSEQKIKKEMKRNISERKRQQLVDSPILKNNLQRKGMN